MSTREQVIETVASAVLRALDASGMPKKTLSDRTGIPRATLYRKLGGFGEFNFSELFVIAAVLGVEPAVFTPPVFRDSADAHDRHTRESVEKVDVASPALAVDRRSA
ncbi:helix-turn-helix domain-containing protein [Pseudoclavibacter sp. 13-3]|uniref:helix-turn-helix domain-containing protein n=1 Tax=Pseudoclavibacter sp. 13-3 TaxID=2901228 RepID=UPI003FA78A61